MLLNRDIMIFNIAFYEKLNQMPEPYFLKWIILIIIRLQRYEFKAIVHLLFMLIH